MSTVVYLGGMARLEARYADVVTAAGYRLIYVRANGDVTAHSAVQGLGRPCGPTGMCNRLKALWEMHWLGRRKVGRQWVYFALPFGLLILLGGVP